MLTTISFTLRENQQSEYLKCPNGHDFTVILGKTTRKTRRLVWCPHCKAEMRPYTKRIEGVLP